MRWAQRKAMRSLRTRRAKSKHPRVRLRDGPPSPQREELQHAKVLLLGKREELQHVTVLLLELLIHMTL